MATTPRSATEHHTHDDGAGYRHDDGHGNDDGHGHRHGNVIPLRAAEAVDRAPHAHNLGPTYDSTVVMDIGGETGGLVVYTEPGQLGVEIDIFERGHDTPMTHTAIRERQLPNGVQYAGVYPGLPAGDYTVAPIGSHPATDVTVVGGAVVEIHTEG
jgi:hypothetical protein